MSERWKRFLGIGKESAWGTPVASTAWLTHYGKDSLKQDKQILELDGTQETRSKIEVVGGDVTSEGEIPDIEAVPNVIGLLLEAAFGDVAAGVYTLKDGILPSLTIEKQVGSTLFYQFTGMKVQSLSFASRARETLKMNASLVGKRAITGGTPTARVYSIKKPFVFYQGAMKIDTATALIREFDLSIANTLLHPNFQSGDIYTQEQLEGVREVSGSMLLDFKTTAIREKFQNVQYAALEYTFTSGSDSLKIELPRVFYPTWTEDENDQTYLQRVEFKGLRIDDDNKEVKITLVIA